MNPLYMKLCVWFMMLRLKIYSLFGNDVYWNQHKMTSKMYLWKIPKTPYLLSFALNRQHINQY